MHFQGGGVGHTTGFRANMANVVSKNLFKLLGYDPCGIHGGVMDKTDEIYEEDEDNEDGDGEDNSDTPIIKETPGDSDEESLAGDVDLEADEEDEDEVNGCSRGVDDSDEEDPDEEYLSG